MFVWFLICKWLRLKFVANLLLFCGATWKTKCFKEADRWWHGGTFNGQGRNKQQRWMRRLICAVCTGNWAICRQPPARRKRKRHTSSIRSINGGKQLKMEMIWEPLTLTWHLVLPGLASTGLQPWLTKCPGTKRTSSTARDQMVLKRWARSFVSLTSALVSGMSPPARASRRWISELPPRFLNWHPSLILSARTCGHLTSILQMAQKRVVHIGRPCKHQKWPEMPKRSSVAESQKASTISLQNYESPAFPWEAFKRRSELRPKTEYWENRRCKAVKYIIPQHLRKLSALIPFSFFSPSLQQMLATYRANCRMPLQKKFYMLTLC